MAATEPSMVIFDTSTSQFQSSRSSPLKKHVILSLENGPVKERSSFRRGRPRKCEYSNRLMWLDLDIETASQAQAPKEIMERSVTSLPAYEFVAWTNASGNTSAVARTLVRSHAMRHRTLKLRRDQSKWPFIARNWKHSELCRDQFKAFLVTMPQEILTLDPFDSLAVRMQPYMPELFAKYITCIYQSMYSIETSSNYNPMREYLLPMAFKDLAVFHAVLFSSVCLKSLSPRYKEVPRALTHLKECIHIVNERLGSPCPTVDDSTILVVATIAYVEKLIGRHVNWEIHMRGLKQMVQLRGGLKIFQSNRVLYDIIRRTDLCGSVDAGSRPFFAEAGVSTLTSPMIQSTTYSSKGFHKINNVVPFTNDFNLILCRVEGSTTALGLIHCGGTPIHPLDLREEITSIQYALLHIDASQYDFHESKVQRICRYGLLLYLVSLLLLNGLPSGASICEMVAGHLRDALQNNVDGNRISQELRLWLVLIIFTMVCDETNRSWAEKEFTSIVLDSGLYRQEDVKAVLVTFFWVEKIHKTSFDELWNETVGSEGYKNAFGSCVTTREQQW